jgi:hypothetical protein
LFCIFKFVQFFKLQNLRELRVECAQTNAKDEEGAEGIRGGLA